MLQLNVAPYYQTARGCGRDQRVNSLSRTLDTLYVIVRLLYILRTQKVAPINTQMQQRAIIETALINSRVLLLKIYAHLY